MDWSAVISCMLLIKFLEYIKLTAFTKGYMHIKLVCLSNTCPRISRDRILPHLLYRSGKSQLKPHKISAGLEPLRWTLKLSDFQGKCPGCIEKLV